MVRQVIRSHAQQLTPRTTHQHILVETKERWVCERTLDECCNRL